MCGSGPQIAICRAEAIELYAKATEVTLLHECPRMENMTLLIELGLGLAALTAITRALVERVHELQ